MKQAEQPLILALTASPGGEEEKIKDVCKNLFIENVSAKEAFIIEKLQPYINLSEDKTKVELKEFVRIKLAKIEDYKQKVRDSLTKLKQVVQDNHQGLFVQVSNVLGYIEELEKELGL